MFGIEYQVSLTDKMSGPSMAASKSVFTLGKSLNSAKKELSFFQSQLALAKKIEDTEGIAKFTAAINSQRKAVFQLSQQFHDLGGNIPKDSFKSSTAPIGEIGGVFAKTGLAIFGAIGAITAATGALMKFAIDSSHAKEQMIQMFAALGGGQEVGIKTEAMISKLSDKLNIAKDDLAPFTEKFMAMGFQGEESLQKLTTAAISAKALFGDAGATAFETLTTKIKLASDAGHGLKIPEKALKALISAGLQENDVASRMGLTTKQFAAQMKAGTIDAKKFGDALDDALITKGAGPLAVMSHSMENMGKMFKQSISDMFEDLGPAIEPFMKGLQGIMDIFKQSTPSGQVMKGAIGGAMTFIFKKAKESLLPIKHFMLDIIIWSLKTYIFILDHWSKVRTIFKGVSVLVKSAAYGFGILAAAVIVATLAAAALTVGFWYLVGSVAEGISKIKGLWKEFLGWANGLGDKFTKAAAGWGHSLIEGLVGGIKADVGMVKDAVGSVVTAVKNAVIHPLGIGSPSKVMFKLGGFTSEGFAGGINSGAPKVAQASTRMGASAVAGTSVGVGTQARDYAPRPKRDRSDGGGGKSGMSIEGLTINITAPNGVTNASDLTETALSLVFERLALSQGVM